MNTKTTRKQILVVEDDNDLQALVGLSLKSAGYDVFHATNGKEAKEQLKTLRADLIILDLMMPVLDGIVFLRWLRREAQLEVPVLVLTAINSPDAKREVLELGVSEVVFKPIEPEEVVEHVNACSSRCL